MSKKDNFGKAMYDMFGVGKGGQQPPAQPEEPEEASDSLYPLYGDSAPVDAPAPVEPVVEDYRVETAIPIHTFEGTYLAAGTMFQGTLNAKGDVEIAGDFEGEIVAKGVVTIHSDISSKITATGLVLLGCSLLGNVEIAGNVTLDGQSSITGDVRAENMVCSGKIKGDLDIQDNLVLEELAEINGNIKVDTMSMARGAKIYGAIEMRGPKK